MEWRHVPGVVGGVQLLSPVWLFATPWTAACQTPLSSTISQTLLKFIFIELVMLSNISSSAASFSFCLQTFPVSRSFPMSQLFTSGGQSIGASAPIFPVNSQGWFLLGLTSLISLLPKGLLSFLQHHNLKASILWCSAFFMVQLTHPYMITGKTIALTRWTLFGKVISMLFNMLTKFVIVFLPRSKHLLISWLQSSSTVIWESKKENMSLLSIFPFLFAMK